MDESVRLRMRTAHAKHNLTCSCGRVVFGNGGKASHKWMHEQRQDGHHAINTEEWMKRFGEGRDPRPGQVWRSSTGVLRRIDMIDGNIVTLAKVDWRHKGPSTVTVRRRNFPGSYIFVPEDQARAGDDHA